MRRLEDLHAPELMAYPRGTDNPVGLLINLNVVLPMHGIKGVINIRARY